MFRTFDSRDLVPHDLRELALTHAVPVEDHVLRGRAPLLRAILVDVVDAPCLPVAESRLRSYHGW